jgi:hypothetical protein
MYNSYAPEAAFSGGAFHSILLSQGLVEPKMNVKPGRRLHAHWSPLGATPAVGLGTARPVLSQ